jgi:hypothetical protein
MRVYGPYTRKDGRKHVILIDTDGKKVTKSYPRYLMEQHLGRSLADDETVDHVNEDFTDDRIENLQLMTRVANAKKSFTLRGKPAEIVDYVCPQCGASASKLLREYNHNKRQGKAGPYCSRSCAGIASHQISAVSSIG